LTHLHVFPYSDRPGTAASTMNDKVGGGTVRARARQLRDIGEALTRRFRESQEGTIRPGLTLEDGTLVVTDNYLKVRIPPGLPRNQRIHVRLRTVDGQLTGSPIARPGDPRFTASSALRGAGRATSAASTR
jgi:threonylcarbamoyladenosine tRNA methylthiotransferase MtaB